MLSSFGLDPSLQGQEFVSLVERHRTDAAHGCDPLAERGCLIAIAQRAINRGEVQQRIGRRSRVDDLFQQLLGAGNIPEKRLVRLIRDCRSPIENFDEST